MLFAILSQIVSFESVLHLLFYLQFAFFCLAAATCLFRLFFVYKSIIATIGSSSGTATEEEGPFNIENDIIPIKTSILANCRTMDEGKTLENKQKEPLIAEATFGLKPETNRLVGNKLNKRALKLSIDEHQ